MTSFRQSLARRVALNMFGLSVIVAGGSVVAMRALLLSQLDGTLLHIAEVEARHGAASGTSAFAFHEGVLLQSGQASTTPLTRFAQLWTSDGLPLVRSRNLTSDLVLPPDKLARARLGEVGWSTHEWRGAAIRSIVFPLSRVGAAHGVHVLQVVAPMEPLQRTVWQFGLQVSVLIVVVTGGAFLMGWRLAGTALRPMGEITEQAESMQAGTLSERITAHAEVEEFGRLVSVLNGMFDRLQDTFDGQRRFIADASHELRAPLTVLRGELDVARRRGRSAVEYAEIIDRCRAETHRMSYLVQDLLALARSDAGAGIEHPAELDLLEVAQRVAGRHATLARVKQVSIVVKGTPTIVGGDRSLLERMVENLVANALRHTPEGGQVRLDVTTDSISHVLTVADDGGGVADEHVEHLFERFFRGDPARARLAGASAEGTGLGLAIAKAGAVAHGGTLRFLGNAPGAVFELRLPSADFNKP